VKRRLPLEKLILLERSAVDPRWEERRRETERRGGESNGGRERRRERETETEIEIARESVKNRTTTTN
jgi:hypothetical protein